VRFWPQCPFIDVYEVEGLSDRAACFLQLPLQDRLSLLPLCHFHHPTTTTNQLRHVTATVNMRVGATTSLNRTSVALTILALCMLLLLFLLR
jgi:hypothetical protein